MKTALKNMRYKIFDMRNNKNKIEKIYDMYINVLLLNCLYDLNVFCLHLAPCMV